MSLLIKGKPSPRPTVTQSLVSLLSPGKVSGNNASSFPAAHKELYRSPVPYNSAQSSSHSTVVRNSAAPFSTRLQPSQGQTLFHRCWDHTGHGCVDASSSEDASILNSPCQKLTLVKQTEVSPELGWGLRCEKPG